MWFTKYPATLLPAIFRILFPFSPNLPIKTWRQLIAPMPNPHRLRTHMISHPLPKYVRVILQCGSMVGSIDAEPNEDEGYGVEATDLTSEGVGSDGMGGWELTRRGRGVCCGPDLCRRD